MIYYELIEKKISNRGHIVALSEISSSPRDYEAYISLFGFDKSIIDFVKLNNTVSGFNGDYSMNILYFDVDSEDLEGARVSTIELIKRLCNEFKLSPDDMLLSFSGSKGFHLGLHNKLFDGFLPGPDLPDKIKTLATLLAGDVKNVDLKIYNKNRIFRIPNSLNLKSNLYKIPISFDELSKDIKSIKAQAILPRTDFKLVKPIADLLSNDMLISTWKLARTKTPGEKVEAKEINANSFETPAKGSRNETLFRHAANLFDKSQLNNMEVKGLVDAINKSSGDPLPEHEIDLLVSSAFKKTRDGVDVERVLGKIFIEALPGWIESISPGRRELTLMSEDIDKDIRQNLNGKLVGIIGKGGTRKSLYAQNILLNNIFSKDIRGIYSTMEMSMNNFLSRVIDFFVEGHNTNVSFEFEERKDPASVKTELEGNIAKALGDKLIITDASNLTAKDYDQMIDSNTRKHGRIDILVVDGLSMMGGKGEDVERYSRNTKELKELAKKWDMCIIVICHTTKECEKTVRDASRYVRGSEKILDNVDCHLCTSLVVDVGKGTFEEPAYWTLRFYIYFYNKRGSGKVIRKIFSFEPKQLRMAETTDDPFSYEIQRKGKKKEIKGYADLDI